MPNPYFRFKQFTIYQDRCAMKVGMDGVLLGAWASIDNAQRILDVGTGTGLIALMLAQRSSALIDAVEIDQAAAHQAQDNVRRSPWAERIRVHPTAVQAYADDCPAGYDLIVSNPPFFSQALPSACSARTLARHDTHLNQLELLHAANRLLLPHGRLLVIYPTDIAHQFQAQAEAHGFGCQRKLRVRPTPTSTVKRILLELVVRVDELSKPQPLSEFTETIVLEQSRHHYTPEFGALIKDYYLNG